MLVVRLITSVALLATLGACMQSPPPGADYGPYPSDFKGQVQEAIGGSLIDPYSAHYLFGTPQKVYANNGLIYGGNVTMTGYAIPVEVNAKNRFGGYTGNQDWVCLYSNGVVVQCLEGTADDNPLIHSAP